MKKIIRNIFIILAFFNLFIFGQDYRLLAPQVTGGQTNSSSDLFNLSSNTATQSADPAAQTRSLYHRA